ncbi:hypothetical protein B0T19DRAFT_29899 [Cercophora scortea]|uniref:Secreted protein n=1 Tax=Cercophora scortea TaxID=314031 RepID=A0AAE0MKT5_9PEZI|nr:hypothetical protein B0T19DRAFT_29899 [Cercophora scortea]
MVVVVVVVVVAVVGGDDFDRMSFALSRYRGFLVLCGSSIPQSHTHGTAGCNHPPPHWLPFFFLPHVLILLPCLSALPHRSSFLFLFFFGFWFFPSSNHRKWVVGDQIHFCADIYVSLRWSDLIPPPCSVAGAHAAVQRRLRCERGGRLDRIMMGLDPGFTQTPGRRS